MTEIRLYNTLTRRKEVFTPFDPGRVTMYVCGPTVYNRAHIGNARPAVVFDVLYRLLCHKYGDDAVVYARNFTDIDDKIMAAAEAEGVPIETITARYERHYTDDMAALGVLPPTLTPRATGNVAAMIEMIAALKGKGAAYAVDGHVLFDIGRDAEYGSLSRRPMDEMIAGARVEVAPYKRNPGDFVLWKPSAVEQPGWDSPWGRGRPGWHIECSAMIERHLGRTIDIHGGGLDLQFPHHENEAAQSRCAHGAPLAGVWMHNGFLSMDREKMSKSLGNVVTVGELLGQGHRGEVLRLALLMTHYRQPLDWNERLLEQARGRLGRWAGRLRSSTYARAPLTESSFEAFENALSDDLNTPEALKALGDEIRSFARDSFADLATPLSEPDALSDDEYNDALALHRVTAGRIKRAFEILGLRESVEQWDQASDELIDDVAIVDRIAERFVAKAAKNWAEADRIRDALKAEGIVLEDRPDGTTDWRRA